MLSEVFQSPASAFAILAISGLAALSAGWLDSAV